MSPALRPHGVRVWLSREANTEAVQVGPGWAAGQRHGHLAALTMLGAIVLVWVSLPRPFWWEDKSGREGSQSFLSPADLSVLQDASAIHTGFRCCPGPPCRRTSKDMGPGSQASSRAVGGIQLLHGAGVHGLPN